MRLTIVIERVSDVTWHASIKTAEGLSLLDVVSPEPHPCFAAVIEVLRPYEKRARRRYSTPAKRGVT